MYNFLADVKRSIGIRDRPKVIVDYLPSELEESADDYGDSLSAELISPGLYQKLMDDMLELYPKHLLVQEMCQECRNMPMTNRGDVDRVLALLGILEKLETEDHECQCLGDPSEDCQVWIYKALKISGCHDAILRGVESAYESLRAWSLRLAYRISEMREYEELCFAVVHFKEDRRSVYEVLGAHELPNEEEVVFDDYMIRSRHLFSIAEDSKEADDIISLADSFTEIPMAEVAMLEDMKISDPENVMILAVEVIRRRKCIVSLDLMDVLFEILIGCVRTVQRSHIRSKVKIMGNDIQHPAIFKLIIHLMNGKISKRDYNYCLENLNILLMKNETNCVILYNQQGWTSWIAPMLMRWNQEVRRSGDEESLRSWTSALHDTIRRNKFQYEISILSLMIKTAILTEENPDCLNDQLSTLFNNLDILCTVATDDVNRVVLFTSLKQIQVAFRFVIDHPKHQAYANLFSFLDMIKEFIFFSSPTHRLLLHITHSADVPDLMLTREVLVLLRETLLQNPVYRDRNLLAINKKMEKHFLKAEKQIMAYIEFFDLANEFFEMIHADKPVSHIIVKEHCARLAEALAEASQEQKGFWQFFTRSKKKIETAEALKPALVNFVMFVFQSKRNGLKNKTGMVGNEIFDTKRNSNTTDVVYAHNFVRRQLGIDELLPTDEEMSESVAAMISLI